MLTFVPPTMLSGKDLLLLSNSLLRAAVWEPADEFMRKLHAGEAKAFRFPGGLLILESHKHPETTRLLITAFAGNAAIWKRCGLARELRLIAAEWKCDTIETTCFDARLAAAIVKIGGKVESVTVTLSVEG
jgi:hypothetical protein